MKRYICLISIVLYCASAAYGQEKKSFMEWLGGATRKGADQTVNGAKRVGGAAGEAGRAAFQWGKKEYPQVRETVKENVPAVKEGASYVADKTVDGAQRFGGAASNAGRSAFQWGKKEYPQVRETVREKAPEVKQRVGKTMGNAAEKTKTGMQNFFKGFKKKN